MDMHSKLSTLLFSLLFVGCQAAQEAPPVQEATGPSPCAIGIYDSSNSDHFLVVTGWEDVRRYTLSSGASGNSGDESLIQCTNDTLTLDGTDLWVLRPIEVTDTNFSVDGAKLAGQLLQPVNASADTPLIVFAHGSEELGWIGAVPDLYQMVGRGVSVFVYDKRGTGLSTGQYSQNFPELANDLVAASSEAKRLAQGKFGRFGLIGLSQGGWIAPLAAGRADADFIGIGYGLVVDILEEDASQVALELTEAGYGADILAIGKQITDVTGRLAVSNYQDGLEDLDALKDQYGNEPWFTGIRGGFSGVLLNMSSEDLRENGIPMFDRLNIDWSLKPMDVLRRVDVPQYWALAEEDREAPVEKTLERLQILRAEGQNITIHMFPNTDHGIRIFTQYDDGTRTYKGVADGFYDLMADWAQGEIIPPYGEAFAQ